MAGMADQACTSTLPPTTFSADSTADSINVATEACCWLIIFSTLMPIALDTWAADCADVNAAMELTSLMVLILASRASGEGPQG